MVRENKRDFENKENRKLVSNIQLKRLGLGLNFNPPPQTD
jgi:hypothetical protein